MFHSDTKILVGRGGVPQWVRIAEAREDDLLFAGQGWNAAGPVYQAPQVEMQKFCGLLTVPTQLIWFPAIGPAGVPGRWGRMQELHGFNTWDMLCATFTQSLIKPYGPPEYGYFDLPGSARGTVHGFAPGTAFVVRSNRGPFVVAS